MSKLDETILQPPPSGSDRLAQLRRLHSIAELKHLDRVSNRSGATLSLSLSLSLSRIPTLA